MGPIPEPRALRRVAGAQEEAHALTREASSAFYELAHSTCKRIVWLCGLSPELLAGWALELLLQQACQAVVFVRDLDRSALGALHFK